jgi:hypothetical protein
MATMDMSKLKNYSKGGYPGAEDPNFKKDLISGTETVYLTPDESEDLKKIFKIGTKGKKPNFGPSNITYQGGGVSKNRWTDWDRSPTVKYIHRPIIKPRGGFLRKSWREYQQSRGKNESGVKMFLKGVGNFLDSAVGAFSVPLHLAGYGSKGIIRGLNEGVFRGLEYGLEDVGAGVGHLGHGVGYLGEGIGRGGKNLAGWVTRQGKDYRGKDVENNRKHRLESKLERYQNIGGSVNVIALMLLLVSFISFSFAPSTTGAVIGISSGGGSLAIMIGIIFLVAAFALFQIKRKK